MDRRVLIVDDDPAALRLLEHHLTAGGYLVQSAANGHEALRILLDDAPPLLITDWEMPELNGVELCRAIRAHEGIGFIYTIIVTSHSDKDRLVEAFDAGADDYIAKPFNARELLARLRAGERIVTLEADLARRTREVFRYNAEMEVANRKLAQANDRLNQMATTDELTGLTNRRAGVKRLEELWATAERFSEPLACIMLDIDHFKRINDSFGHAVGDAVLRRVAATILHSARKHEVVCRIGGEEFVVLCPKSTGEMAAEAAERFRRAVGEDAVHCDGAEIRPTVSLGVADRQPSMQRPEDLLKASDEALYIAKRRGRNRVCLAPSAAGRNVAPAAADGPSQIESAAGVRGARADTQVLVIGAPVSGSGDVRRVLEQDGFLPAFATDDEHAIGEARERPPHVVVVDATVPQCDGITRTRRLKADAVVHEVPLILVLPPGDVDGIAAGLRAGAEECISLPANPHELALRVDALAKFSHHRVDLVRSNEVRGEQTRMLTLLADFAQMLATTDGLDTILDRTLAVVTELTCSRRACILMPDQKGSYLHVARYVGDDPLDEVNARFLVGGGLLGHVFESLQRVVAPDREEVRTLITGPERRLIGNSLLLCVPLCTSEHPVGVMLVADRHGDVPLSPAELEFVHMMSHIAASAIDDMLVRRSRDEARDSIVVALANLAERRDDSTGRHLDRVSRFCVTLASALRSFPEVDGRIDDAYISDLLRAVPLHDIGKVAIPDAILLKPGRLTPDEMAIMKTHARIGAQTLRSVLDRAPGASFLVMAEQIALCHHEWYDGTGYPQGLKGEDIPLAARIVALADVYDALTSDRIYRKAMDHKYAADLIMERTGTQFDPLVVNAFERCANEFEGLAAAMSDSLGGHEPSGLHRGGHMSALNARPAVAAAANVDG